MDLASIGWVFAFVAMISAMSLIVVASSAHYRDRALQGSQGSQRSRTKPHAGTAWIGRQR